MFLSADWCLLSAQTRNATNTEQRAVEMVAASYVSEKGNAGDIRPFSVDARAVLTDVTTRLRRSTSFSGVGAYSIPLEAHDSEHMAAVKKLLGVSSVADDSTSTCFRNGLDKCSLKPHAGLITFSVVLIDGAKASIVVTMLTENKKLSTTEEGRRKIAEAAWIITLEHVAEGWQVTDVYVTTAS
jgi:hypothetical protein